MNAGGRINANIRAAAGSAPTTRTNCLLQATLELSVMWQSQAISSSRLSMSLFTSLNAPSATITFGYASKGYSHTEDIYIYIQAINRVLASYDNRSICRRGARETCMF